ncbi:MAG: LPS assembly lipoprotein LptE [Burkholderiales bacterium]
MSPYPSALLVEEAPADRRIWLIAMASLATVPLASCGFQLRGAQELRFRTVQLAGFKPHSPLEKELRRAINASQTTRVVDSGGEAQVVLEAISERRERNVVATTSAGQVRQISLRVRFTFKLRTPSDRELIGSTELLLGRDISYNESEALAKEQEEALLYREMQTDIVSQIMRRLSAVPTL